MHVDKLFLVFAGIFIEIVTFSYAIADMDYCSIICRGDSSGKITLGSHTMCKYNKSEPGNACGTYINYSLTSVDKEQILIAHNSFRSRVACGEEHGGFPGPQPPATNMMFIKWDEELERVARRWADQCIMETYDSCRDVDRFPVGQNVVSRGPTTSTNRSINYLMHDWFRQVHDFDSRSVSGFKYSPVDRVYIESYVQLVWAETYLIGCGRSAFRRRELNGTGESEAGNIYVILVCNYGPSNIARGIQLYDVGPTCSACPLKSRCVTEKENYMYMGLCYKGPLPLIRNGFKGLKRPRMMSKSSTCNLIQIYVYLLSVSQSISYFV